MSEWQTIATAPLSGRILVWCPRMKTSFVVDMMTSVEDGERSWVYARQLGLGANGQALAFVVSAPTHWMPSPAPPARTEQEE